MKIKSCRYLSLVALLLAVSGTGQSAEVSARFALVIGNGAYEQIGALRNPTADAELMAATLEELGFTTELVTDSSQLAMKKSIANFGRTLRKANKNAVGFFYYAGHGIQSNGRNYLLPVEATPADEADLDLMGVEANWVLRQMESAGNRTNIIVLDACRNNPFVSANRSMGRGLAQIDAPTGSFISYATAPGKVALDGDSTNSPFTIALAEQLNLADTPIEQIFKKVRVNVIKATNGAQIPWDSSSLVEDFYMKPAPEPAAVAEPVQASAAETELWASINESGGVGSLSYFLQLYPEGPFADEAKQQLERALLALTADTPTTPPGPTQSEAQNQELVGNRARNGIEMLVTEPQPILKEQDTGDPAAEFDLYAQAESSRTKADFERYLELYPEGKFAAIVIAELDNMEQSASAVVAPQNPRAEKGVKKFVQPRNLTYSSPLSINALGDGTLRSIEELAKGTPLHAPFEGLEEAYWKTQQCSNCHNWDKASLCTQGSFYSSVDEEALGRIKHPYGGEFKSNLRRWANQGCN